MDLALLLLSVYVVFNIDFVQEDKVLSIQDVPKLHFFPQQPLYFWSHL